MNKSAFQIYSVFLFMALGYSSYSQNCDLSIKGELIDTHDKSDLIGALVTLEGTNFYFQSEFTGQYLIDGICPGKYVLSVSHPECSSYVREIYIKENKFIKISLEHHLNELNEIIVSDSKINQLNKSVRESIINLDEINKYGSNTLVDALSFIPGASILKTGNSIGKPIIHGMYGSRVGIITDGFRQYDQQWGPDHAPNIDFDQFETIRLIKGASALKYGGDTSAGSIILSSKRKVLRDTLFGSTSINLESNGRGGKFSSRLEKNYANGFFINGNLTGKRYGDFNAPNYNLSNTGFKEANFSIKLGKDLVTRGWTINFSNYNLEPGILRASHIGNVQDLFFALNSSEPTIVDDFSYDIDAPRQLAKHQKLTFKYFKSCVNNVKFELGYNYQNNSRQEFDIRRGGRTGIPVVDLLLKTHIISANLSNLNSNNWNFELGINGMIQDNYSTPDTGVKRLIPDYIKFENGLYITGTYQKSNSFLWEWGVRLDYINYDSKKYYYKSVWQERNFNSLFEEFETGIEFANQILVNPKFEYLNFSAQTGISLNLLNSSKLNFSYIMSQRAPNPSELFSDGLHHSMAAIEYGDLTLKPETNHKLLFSYMRKESSYSLNLEPFISKSFDYIFIEPTGFKQTIRGAFPVWTYKSTDAILAGIDFSSELYINKNFTFNFGVSYVFAQDILNNEPLILIPPLNSYQNIKFLPVNQKWSFEISHHASAKQNRFPNSNFIFDYIENGTIVSKTVDISDSPGGYQKLDGVLSFKVSDKNDLKTTLRLIVQNITNAEYRDYLNRMRFYSSELGRNIQLQLNFNY